MISGNGHELPARFQRLSGLVDLLTDSGGVRHDLVTEIRAQVDKGDYLTEEKLNFAIHRLLRELMTDEEERVS